MAFHFYEVGLIFVCWRALNVVCFVDVTPFVCFVKDASYIKSVFVVSHF